MGSNSVGEVGSIKGAEIKKPRLPKADQVVRGILDALEKCENVWVQRYVNQDLTTIKVAGRRIFLGGIVDSQIARESALDTIKAWQRETRNKMEVVDNTAINSKNLRRQREISERYIIEEGLVEGAELEPDERPEVIDTRSFSD